MPLTSILDNYRLTPIFPTDGRFKCAWALSSVLDCRFTKHPNQSYCTDKRGEVSSSPSRVLGTVAVSLVINIAYNWNIASGIKARTRLCRFVFLCCAPAAHKTRPTRRAVPRIARKQLIAVTIDRAMYSHFRRWKANAIILQIETPPFWHDYMPLDAATIISKLYR